MNIKKALIIVLSFAAFVVSCKKNTTLPPGDFNPVAPVIKFKGNGQQYEWTGVYGPRPSWESMTVILLCMHDSSWFSDGDGVCIVAEDYTNNRRNRIIIPVTTDSFLTDRTYRFSEPNFYNSRFNIGEIFQSTTYGVEYYAYRPQDRYTVTVSNIRNGYYSGTFEGSVWDAAYDSAMVITEGTFSNIRKGWQ